MVTFSSKEGDMGGELFRRSRETLRQRGVSLGGFGLVFLAGAALLRAAETGDFDGDGKLTIADMNRVAESAEDPSVELAPGSLDAFAKYPPYAMAEHPLSLHGPPTGSIPMAVYLESFRRTLADSFPPYFFMHWPETWLEKIEQGPLPEDPRVSVELLPVKTAGEPMVAVPMRLTATAPVRAFSLVLESRDGMLRVPWVWIEEPYSRWKDTDWGRTSWHTLAGKHDDGDLTVNVPPAGYLASGGRYVVITL